MNAHDYLTLPNRNPLISAIDAHAHLMAEHGKNLATVIARLELLDEIMATLEHPENQRHLPAGLLSATAGWRLQLPLPEKPFTGSQQAGKP